MAELNEEQLLLLNNLVYLDASCAPGQSVGSVVTELLENGGLEGVDIGGGMTEEDAVIILEAIAQDETLMSMKIDSCVDTEIRGVCFTSDEVGAVIAYRGTGPTYAAWDDNCQGGYLSDTDMQQEALEFAQNCARRHDDLTVTGHSKGGNMAQYVTVLMGDEVDRCVSFDGQGFSDEFLLKYGKEIIQNKDKIRSVCSFNDYVNILLTPIAGETVYLDNENPGIMEGHYAHELYKASANEMDENGEYIQSRDQAGYIVAAKTVEALIVAAIDLGGYKKPVAEFLIYSLFGTLMGIFISDEGKKWEEIDWKKILQEVLENLEDFSGIEFLDFFQKDHKETSYYVSVNTDALRDYSTTMSTAAGQIESLRSEIQKLQRKLATNIISGVAVGLPLQLVLTQLDTEVNKLERLAGFLTNAADQYDAAENTAKSASQ